MREIIFRGKDAATGKWHYGTPDCFIDDMEHERAYIDTNDEQGHRASCIEVQPHTLSQYTGMHDSIGQRIFEGDTCALRHLTHDEPVVVEYRDGAFVARNMEGDKTYPLSRLVSHGRVTGNIFDNPDNDTAQ